MCACARMHARTHTHTFYFNSVVLEMREPRRKEVKRFFHGCPAKKQKTVNQTQNGLTMYPVILVHQQCWTSFSRPWKSLVK